MTHDPLCPRPFCDYGQVDGDCTGYEDCEHDCRCALIKQVRADEREQAAQRVETQRSSFRARDWDDAIAVAAAAARGEA